VIDADLSGYFDAIPHRKLMELVAKRVSDGGILALIKAWLEAPIAEEDKDTGKRRIKPNDKGTPQGGVISPLLANLYLDDLDKGVNDRCNLKPVMVRYADDFVIMSRPGQAEGLMKRLKVTLEGKELRLNEEKTKIKDVRKEGFDFLGFSVSWRKSMRTGRGYPHVEPSRKSRKKLYDKMKEILASWKCWQSIEEVIGAINRVMSGWANYFYCGHPTRVFGKMQWLINQKLRRWIRKKHGGRVALYKDTPDEKLYALGLYRMPQTAAWKQAST
jgi:RNA-directed DNA polymerase